MIAATFQIDVRFEAVTSGMEFTDFLAADPPAMTLMFQFKLGWRFTVVGQTFQRAIQSPITLGGMAPLPEAKWLLAGALPGLDLVRRRMAK